jgi:hypothetical protein
MLITILSMIHLVGLWFILFTLDPARTEREGGQGVAADVIGFLAEKELVTAPPTVRSALGG